MSKQLFFILLAIGLFQLATHYREPATSDANVTTDHQIVISAPIQLVMYAGDRFLAANLEAMRVAAVGTSEEGSLAEYRMRAHTLVSELNACHEDNYYLANAVLSWGGLVDQGNTILKRASECRSWDEFPPFFLGFNLYFFFHDLNAAKQAIDSAASRSTANAAMLKKLSIAISAKKLNDEAMAVNYLRSQRDQTRDKKLAAMLERRLQRLQGLITLRRAQNAFETKYGRALKEPDELLTSGILDAPPQDPMRLGYEFVDGSFRMRAAKIGGIEVR